jgi:hypothetical protein
VLQYLARHGFLVNEKKGKENEKEIPVHFGKSGEFGGFVVARKLIQDRERLK